MKHRLKERKSGITRKKLSDRRPIFRTKHRSRGGCQRNVRRSHQADNYLLQSGEIKNIAQGFGAASLNGQKEWRWIPGRPYPAPEGKKSMRFKHIVTKDKDFHKA